MPSDVPSALLHLRIAPGARENAIRRTVEGHIAVRIAAPAREGKANQQLLAYLAELLDLPPSRLTLRRGQNSRHKVVEVEGLTVDDALARLGL